MPVSSRVSSADANEALRTPSWLVTTRFTSRRSTASTMQAAYTRGVALPTTMIVLAESSGSNRYAAQNRAVSASSGSHGNSSYGTPRTASSWWSAASTGSSVIPPPRQVISVNSSMLIMRA